MFTDLMVSGMWDDMVALNDDTNVDTGTLYPFVVVMSNRGGVQQSFSTAITNIPCRVDVQVKGLIPQREKDNIEAEKVIRYLYLSRVWVKQNSIMPKIKDEFETSAGNPLGTVERYRVLNVDIESDDIDIEILIEVVV
jgi:hypothetical protein